MTKVSHVVLSAEDQTKKDIESLKTIFTEHGISIGLNILHNAWSYSLIEQCHINQSVVHAVDEYNTSVTDK